MRNLLSLTIIFIMIIVTLGRTEYCEEWQSSGVYYEGDKVCYEGQGYVANRDVCASCSPELDYYWSPTEDCDCEVPPQNDWQPSGDDIYYDAGNVGIGKAPSPDYNLDVDGDANVKDWIYTYGLSATNTISILSGSKIAWMDYDSIYIASGFGKKTSIKPHQIDLYEAGQGATTLRARDITTPFLNAGDAQVDGVLWARKVTVTLDAFPDHVFSESHSLKSLEEIEEYINKNGKLPGMPSEKEVKKNGIDLGEMNAKLVEKIEEMTLHLISLEKKNKALEAEVNTLKNKMENK